jgi:hypothetical protein
MQLAGLGAFGTAAGAVAALDPKPALMVVAATAVCAFVLCAIRWPLPAFALTTATLAFVPVYAAPRIGDFDLNPTALGFWLIVIAECLRRRERGRTLRLTVLDAAVLIFAGSLFVSVLASVHTIHDDTTPVFLWLGPYLAARLVLSSAERLFQFLKLIAVLGVFTAPIVALEYLSGSNFFTSLSINPVQAASWAVPQIRLGTLRVAGAFGHPLALAMFLVSASLICIALWLSSRDRVTRWAWLLAAGVTFGAQILTLSRTGWVMAAVGVVLLAIIYYGPRAKLRLGMVLGAAAVCLVAALAVLPTERTTFLATFGSGPAELPANITERKDLASVALQPGVLKLAGNHETAFVQSVRTPSDTYRTEPASVDNNYIYLADFWGLITLAAFLLVSLVVAALFLKLRSTVLAVLPAVVLANLVALYFVAFLTQQQVFFWLLVGACGSVAQLHRRDVTLASLISTPNAEPPK